MSPEGVGGVVLVGMPAIICVIFYAVFRFVRRAQPARLILWLLPGLALLHAALVRVFGALGRAGCDNACPSSVPSSTAIDVAVGLIALVWLGVWVLMRRDYLKWSRPFRR